MRLKGMVLGMLALSLLVGQAAGAAELPYIRYYNQAKQLEREGRLEEAEKALRMAVAAHPGDYLNYVKLASVISRLGKTNEAISLYNQALALNADDPMVYLSLGAIYEQTGDYAEAEKAYSRALMKNTAYTFGYFNLARTQIQQEAYDAAIKSYNRFLSAYPDHYEGRKYLAHLLLVTEQPKLAAIQYEALKKKFPNRFGEHVELARALTRSDAPEKALEALKSAYAQEGNRADILIEMGNAHLALGQADYALMNLDKAYRLDPVRDELLLEMAEIYGRQNALDEAAGKYRAYLAKHPDNVAVRQRLANLYITDGQYEAAIAELDTLLKDTTDEALRYRLEKETAYAYHMKGDLFVAIPRYEVLLADERAKDDLQLHTNLALAYHKAEDYQKAIPLYKKAYYGWRIQPVPADAAENSDDAKRAQTQMKNRTVLGNDLANAMTAYADKLYAAKDYDEALRLYGEATLYADDGNHLPYLGLGHTYQALGLSSRAYDAYAIALKRDPDNVQAKLYQAKIELKEQNNAASLPTLIKLAEEHPDDVDVQLALGDAYLGLNDPAQAALVYERALSKLPETEIQKRGQILMALGGVWQRLGNHQRASEAYAGVLKLQPDNALAYYNLGIAYNELDQLDQSAASYRKALELDAAFTDSRYGLAVTLEKQKKYEEALDTYELYAAQSIGRYQRQAKERIELLRRALSTPESEQPSATPDAGPPTDQLPAASGQGNMTDQPKDAAVAG